MICLASLFFMFLNQPIWANDFHEKLRSIANRSKAIDSKMSELGFVQDYSQPRTSSDKTLSPILITHNPAKFLYAQAGRIIKAKTLNRLVVAAEGSPALVEISSSEGIFSGLKVIGKARISSSPGRLQIDFDRLILRSGKVASIQALALDEVGAYGLSAQVITGKTWAVTGAMAGSFVSGLAASQQTESTTAFGFSQTERTGRNAVLQGLAQTAADQSKRLIDESTQEKPVLIVEPGTAVGLFINEEVRL